MSRSLPLVFAAVAACGEGLERHPGAGPAQAPVVNDTYALPIGTIGRACGAIGSGGLRAVALSRDDQLVALGYGSGLVVVHAMGDGAPVNRFTAHAAPISALVFLPDGALATASTEGDVSVWPGGGDAPPRALLGSSTAVSALLANQDGSVLVAVEATAVRAWRVSDEKPLWRDPLGEPPAGPKAFVVGPQRLLVIAGPRAELRDFDGENRLVLTATGLPNRDILDVSPDGTLAVGVLGLSVPRAPGDPAAQEIGVFAYPHGERIWGRRTVTRPIGARFSRDGARVVFWYDPFGGLVAPQPDSLTFEPLGLAVYHAATGDRGHTRRESPASDTLTVLPVGAADRLLLPRVAAVDDQGLEVLALAGTAPGWRASIEPGHSDPLEEVVLASGDAPIAITRARRRSDHTVRAWDLDSGKQIFARTPSTPIALDPAGRHLLVTRGIFPTTELPPGVEPPQPVNDNFELVRLPDGMVVRTFGRSSCYLAVFTPDGRHLWAACGARGGRLRRFDVATGDEDRVFGHGARPVALAISPDGGRIATREHRNSMFDGIALWTPGNERPLWGAESDRASSIRDEAQVGHLVFSPDGRLLASWSPGESEGGGEGKVRVYAAATGKLLANLVPTHVANAGAGQLGHGLSFSADGRLLAARGLQLTVWRTSDWARFVPPSIPPRFIVPGHPGGALAFVGTDLFLGGADFRLHKLCDVQLPAPPAN